MAWSRSCLTDGFQGLTSMARAAVKNIRKQETVGRGKSAPKSGMAKGGSVARPSATLRKAADLPVAPKLSKDELRSQVEKLEATVITQRAKSRDANRALKAATARIAELEAQVARLERSLVASRKAPGRPPARQTGARRERSRTIDAGDAVPPGVAVMDPAPLDAEAEAALENLEEHLGGEKRGAEQT